MKSTHSLSFSLIKPSITGCLMRGNSPGQRHEETVGVNSPPRCLVWGSLKVKQTHGDEIPCQCLLSCVALGGSVCEDGEQSSRGLNRDVGKQTRKREGEKLSRIWLPRRVIVASLLCANLFISLSVISSRSRWYLCASPPGMEHLHMFLRRPRTRICRKGRVHAHIYRKCLSFVVKLPRESIQFSPWDSAFNVSSLIWSKQTGIDFAEFRSHICQITISDCSPPSFTPWKAVAHYYRALKPDKTHSRCRRISIKRQRWMCGLVCVPALRGRNLFCQGLSIISNHPNMCQPSNPTPPWLHAL